MEYCYLISTVLTIALLKVSFCKVNQEALELSEEMNLAMEAMRERSRNVQAGKIEACSGKTMCCYSKNQCFFVEGDCVGDSGCLGSMVCGQNNCKDMLGDGSNWSLGMNYSSRDDCCTFRPDLLEYAKKYYYFKQK